MKRFRLATVSLFCLVSFAASASAECAWVLWGRLESLGWTRDEVYPTYSKCWVKIDQRTGIPEEGSFTDWVDWVRRLGRYDNRMRGKDLSNLKPGELYVGARNSGAVVIINQTVTEWVCLPDTVDPRGPRGK